MISSRTRLLISGPDFFLGGLLLLYWEHRGRAAQDTGYWDIRSDREFWTPELFMAIGIFFLVFALISLREDLHKTKH